MQNWSLSNLAKQIRAHHYGIDIELPAISIDSRTIKKGQCFLAIKGPNFDGHDFVADAIVKGASSIIVNHKMPFVISQLIVNDSKQALIDIAKIARDNFQGPVIALTGSCGKTTTKMIIAKILEQQYEKILATEGNKNNQIGVPLTLSSLRSNMQAAILEIGTNSPGEIAPLSKLVKPSIALLLNAKEVHLEGLGDVLGVAREKGDIFSGLPVYGHAVIPIDSEYTTYWQACLKGQAISFFGFSEKASIKVSDINISPNMTTYNLHLDKESVAIKTKLLGKHNVLNALAAANVCVNLGCSLTTIAKGLISAETVTHRFASFQSINGAYVIDDSYNANPSAVIEAIDFLKSTNMEIKGLILGDMGELGVKSISLHEHVGHYAKESGINYLWTYGKNSEYAAKAFGMGAMHFTEKTKLISELLAKIDAKGAYLIKGSRSARLEEVVAALKQN